VHSRTNVPPEPPESAKVELFSTTVPVTVPPDCVKVALGRYSEPAVETVKVPPAWVSARTACCQHSAGARSRPVTPRSLHSYGLGSLACRGLSASYTVASN
jgi:hypothetical protein